MMMNNFFTLLLAPAWENNSCLNYSQVFKKFQPHDKKHSHDTNYYDGFVMEQIQIHIIIRTYTKYD